MTASDACPLGVLFSVSSGSKVPIFHETLGVQFESVVSLLSRHVDRIRDEPEGSSHSKFHAAPSKNR